VASDLESHAPTPGCARQRATKPNPRRRQPLAESVGFAFGDAFGGAPAITYAFPEIFHKRLVHGSRRAEPLR